MTTNREELLQCFDEFGNPTEIRTRAEVKQEPPRFWYGVARVWVMNDRGEILVSERSSHMNVNAGKWSTWFGGHVGAGETIKEAAQRELHEETGLDLALEQFFFVDKGKNETKKVFFENYAVRLHDLENLKIQNEEISEIQWMKISDCQTEVERNPERWANIMTEEQIGIIKELTEER